MPSLVLLKSPDGATSAPPIPLDRDTMVLGRYEKDCQILIPHTAVSRTHAQITRTNGQFFIEDLNSRNHTYVNGKEITALTPLKPDDRIKICDFLYRFHDERLAAEPPKPIPPEWRDEADDDEDGGQTTIEAVQQKGTIQGFLEVQPSDRLRALLEISTGLSKTLDLDPLLGQIAETLFGVFRQADRCFVILLDEANGRPIPKVVKSRRPGMEDTRFSKTIVRKALESMHAYLSEDASSDASLGPAASIAEFRIRSVMCVPLANADGRPLGAIQLDTQERSKKFKEEDLNLLAIVANLASVAIEKAKLHQAVLAREKERKEIELARTVQLGFLPQTVPDVDGYEFFSHYSPAQTVGGDYYDFIPMRDGRVAVVVGDVAGKGVPAALLVAKLSSEVRFCLLTEPTLAKAVNCLNDAMIRGGLGDRFVTLFAAILDPVNHEMTLVNAGHMNPRLFHGAQNKLALAMADEAAGVPLGVLPGYEYEAVTVPLGAGDTLTIYTDGVTDAMAPNEALFGEDGLDKYLTPDDSVLALLVNPKATGERLVGAVRKHANGRAQNDDIAVVCFGRLDPNTKGPKTVVSKAATATPLETNLRG
jgi:sigma-B regulation protein RsbU (phosphoserine phosphatase)